MPVRASIQGHSIGGCCGHCTLQESRHLSSTAGTAHSETRHAVLPQLEKFENEQRLHEKGRERERERNNLQDLVMPVQLVRHPLLKRHLVLSRSFLCFGQHACLDSSSSFQVSHTFMPDEKSMHILLTFASSLVMDFCSGGRNAAYAYNRKEAKAGVARYTGTSNLHFGMATSTETTHAIVNNFDLLVCHMTYCHILSHIVTYCHILSHIVTYCHILSHWSRLERFIQDFQLHGASRFCPHTLSIFGMKRTPSLN